jgi:hypothetical protein
VVRSIAQGSDRDARATVRRGLRNGFPTAAVGLAVVVLLLATYLVSNPRRDGLYAHFTWQAAAWLEGETAIRYPVPAVGDRPANDYYQDVIPASVPGRGEIPFPPLPAVVLLPFVAIWGLATNAQLLGAFVAALDIGVAFWVLGRLPLDRRARVAATVFFGLGTVFWYSAAVATTWFFAHLVAVGLGLGAVGLALAGDPGAASGEEPPHGAVVAPAVGGWLGIDRRQVLAGLCFGLAATARLTVVFGAPFFVLVGAGRDWRARALGAALGAALPLGALFAYTYLTTGQLQNPVYETLYRLEALSYPQLGYRIDWALEDPRYLVRNLPLMLAGLPDILPACTDGASVRGLFSAACPWVVPKDVGMGLLLTSPAWLLAVPTLRRWAEDRLVTGAVLATVAIAVVDLMHFSQGWVQFGYRFSLDWLPFALPLLAIGLVGLRRRWIGYGLIAVSVAVNAWGVAWGRILGW